MSQFEFRCPVHGHIRDVNMDLYDTTKTCPREVEDVPCAMSLVVAEQDTETLE